MAHVDFHQLTHLYQTIGAECAFGVVALSKGYNNPSTLVSVAARNIVDIHKIAAQCLLNQIEEKLTMGKSNGWDRCSKKIFLEV